MRDAGVRRSTLLALLSAGAAALALAAYGAFLVLRAADATGRPAALPLLILLGLLALVLAGLWMAAALLRRHFRDLERLRGALLVATGSGGDARSLDAAARDVGAETRRLADAAGRLVAAGQVQPGDSRVLGDRLAAILAAASEGLIVLTDSGLVSLVNAAALQRLGARRVAVGTSVYAALERERLVAAQHRAQAAGRPLRETLTTVEGEALEAVIVDLGAHNGLVLCLPAVAEATHTPALEHDLGLHDAVPEMAPVADSTPLEALSALVLDSETTGLDVAVARVVSLGAVRLQGRRLYAQASFDCLVRPDVPIPAASTAIHGIGDALVAGAPPIAEALPRLEALIGPGAVIGHNIAFDLTILANEAERCGRPWRAPPSLDTRLLMAALEPNLRRLDLEDIAGRLDVPVEGRHTALGDALVTAAVYVRLLPRLADAGVTTFGGARAFAERARALRARQAAAGWKH